MVVVVSVVVVVVAKVLVWDAGIIEVVVVVEALFIGVLADVVIALEFAAPVSYFGDILSPMTMDVSAGVAADVIMGFVADIGVEVMADANGNVFASLMTALDFAVPKPLESLSW